MKVHRVKKLIYMPLVFGFILSCGVSDRASKLKEAPDYRNNPALMGVKTKKYDGLKKAAKLSEAKTPWSGDYWPTYRGGISYRWQGLSGGTNYSDYQYPLLDATKVFGMPQEELDRLSPAEKYDLLMGDFSFFLTQQEKLHVDRAMRDEDGNIPHWYGLCHGWAAASYMEKEPGPKAAILSPDGLLLNFYSADLKALFARHYSDAKVRTNFIGGRCNEKEVKRDTAGRALLPECRDTNPATFHLVLEDYIARRQKSFILDADSEHRVWNQPVIGYQFEYANLRKLQDEPSYLHTAQGTTQLVDVELEIKYVLESSPARNPASPSISQRNLSYTLELDKDGFIIGGEWTGHFRPDFLWELHRTPARTADGGLSYQVLHHLLHISRGESFVDKDLQLVRGSGALTASRHD